MYRDGFGLQANKRINNTLAFSECNLTFDALVIQIIHKHALPQNLTLHVYKNATDFPFNNLQYIHVQKIQIYSLFNIVNFSKIIF